MSSRRTRTGQPATSRITEEEITNLVARLQYVVPEIHRRRTSNKVSATKVLQETCNYIKNLNREVGDLSDRLAHLLATTDADSNEAAIIRSLLMRD